MTDQRIRVLDVRPHNIVIIMRTPIGLLIQIKEKLQTAIMHQIIPVQSNQSPSRIRYKITRRLHFNILHVKP